MLRSSGVLEPFRASPAADQSVLPSATGHMTCALVRKGAHAPRGVNKLFIRFFNKTYLHTKLTSTFTHSFSFRGRGHDQVLLPGWKNSLNIHTFLIPIRSGTRTNRPPTPLTYVCALAEPCTVFHFIHIFPRCSPWPGTAFPIFSPGMTFIILFQLALFLPLSLSLFSMFCHRISAFF